VQHATSLFEERQRWIDGTQSAEDNASWQLFTLSYHRYQAQVAVFQQPAFTQEKGPMVKPECFKVEYVTSCHAPYGIEETSGPEMLSSGGVLRKGQPVWLKESLSGRRMKPLVPACVEHLGVISPLDARFLVDLALLLNE
jgi:hypothetical protein